MSLRRLVHYEHPGALTTPILLLAALREIDPTVELVHAGEDRWWLGAVSDNAERRQMAEAMMAQIQRLEVQQQAARTVMLCKLNLQGFALIETYRGPDVTGTVRVDNGEDSYYCTVLEDFRERDAHWRRDEGDRIVETRLDASMRGPERREAEAKAREYLYTDGRAEYRRHMRGKVQALGQDIGERAAQSGLVISRPEILTPAELYF